MNEDALLYQEEHGDIEEPEETPGEKRDRIRRELTEIHLLKLKQFTTADLVRELENREWHECYVKRCDQDATYYMEVNIPNPPPDEHGMVCGHRFNGPATILVVRGERE